jgi:hypothetical protein
MWLRDYLTPLDVGAVFGQLAGLARMMGWLLVLPAGLGWVSSEFLVAGLLSGLSIVALGLGYWGRALLPKDLRLREAFVVTALAYPLFAFAGAIAFLPVAPFIDGFFESMSGFTTTGLTVVDVRGLPRSLRFFRAYMQSRRVSVSHLQFGDRERTCRRKRACERSPIGGDLRGSHRDRVRGFSGHRNAG